MTRRVIQAINGLARAILYKFNIIEAKHMGAFKKIGEEVAEAAEAAGQAEAKAQHDLENQRTMWKINGRRKWL